MAWFGECVETLCLCKDVGERACAPVTIGAICSILLASVDGPDAVESEDSTFDASV